VASELKSTTVEKVHEELLDNISNSYQKTEGFPTWDILKAAAFGIKKLWNKVFNIEYKQDVDNLTGTDLERFIYQRKGLSRKEATFATGYITIVTGEGIIQEGNIFSTESGIEFMALETKEVVAGDKVAIQALVAGDKSNVVADTIKEMPVTIPGIVKITNEDPTVDGYDAEDDDSLRDRYYEALREPATSGNVAHYRRWAREVEGVGHVKVYPLWQGDNTVQVVIADDNGLVPSEDTVARCQEYIDPGKAGTGLGQAPIGAYCTVTPATALNIDIKGTLILDNTVPIETIRAEVDKGVIKYLADIALDTEYISPAKIGNIILSCEGVVDYDNLTVNGSYNRIDVPDKSVAVLGSVVLNAE
jgi:uncharacterized phage protein gp47/JayE